MTDMAERARRIKTHYELPIGRHPERDKDKALREFAAALLAAQQELADERGRQTKREAAAYDEGRVAAEATITRLREALEQLERDGHEWFVNDDGSEGPHLDGCPGCIARAALAQDTEQNEEQERPYIKPADDPHSLVAKALAPDTEPT